MAELVLTGLPLVSISVLRLATRQTTSLTKSEVAATYTIGPFVVRRASIPVPHGAVFSAAPWPPFLSFRMTPDPPIVLGTHGIRVGVSVMTRRRVQQAVEILNRGLETVRTLPNKRIEPTAQAPYHAKGA